MDLSVALRWLGDVREPQSNDAGEDLEPCTELAEVSVVLPAPLRPMLVLSLAEGMPTTSPRFTVRLSLQAEGSRRSLKGDILQRPDDLILTPDGEWLTTGRSGNAAKGSSEGIGDLVPQSVVALL